ncbi:MAG: endonuclease III domain-containing protein [Planctomycetes bacterium]|nr:endonuclease III domain-containing protein [Planctomycetota bacterium]
MKILKEIYQRLFKHFGPQHWWPGETPFEVMVGAILTQNTNWSNVEKAIKNLKAEGLMTAKGLYGLDTETLAQLIRPAGYYNIKAIRLKNFIKWFVETYDGDEEKLSKSSLESLREELLGIKGIGPETADSIALYAGGKPSFVVDAYTYRIFSRHSLIPEETTYDEIKAFFEDNLENDTKLFNEYHALIVRTGKEYCKKTKPLCDKCPLKGVER